MSAAAKDVSASQDKAALEALAGPAMAAMVLPTTVMMSGFVAAWGLGMAFARAFSVSANEAVAGAAGSKAPTPRLVVSNPEPVEAAKPAPAKPTGAPPKPATPGGTPPKPKSAKVQSAKPASGKTPTAKTPVSKAPTGKVVSPKDEAPRLKTGAVKPPVDEKPVVAGPKVAKAGTSVTAAALAAPAVKAKTAAVPKDGAAAPAATSKKVVPTASKPVTIRTTSTSKGISLPKLSIQDKPDGKTGKD